MTTHFGLQANVIIAGSYSNINDKNALLTKELLYPAIRKVARRYPELGMVRLVKPSQDKKGQHRCWTGFLRQIDLKNHVKFVDICGQPSMNSLLERYHGLWFTDEALPPWQLVVVNGREVLFIFDHIITDGRGATTIQAALLEALNEIQEDDQERDDSIAEFTADVPGFPEEDPIKRSGHKVSIIGTIFMVLGLQWIRLLNWFLARPLDDMITRELKFDYSNPRKEENLVKTEINSLTLNSETLQRCVKACHAHGASFTSLLHTLIMVCLVADFYPKSKFAHTQVAMDLRPHLLPSPRKEAISCQVSTVFLLNWLDKYLKAGQQSNVDIENPTKNDLIWELARQKKVDILDDIQNTKRWRTAWQAMDLLGEDDEDYARQLLPSYKSTQATLAFSISNLGVFDPSKHLNPSGNGWTVSGMHFSAGAIPAGFGPPMVFNIMGIKGGDTVIHVSSEQGCMKDDGFMETFLERLRRRLETIL